MTFRPIAYGCVAALAVAACSPKIPDSGAGVLDPQAVSTETRGVAVTREAQLDGTLPPQSPVATTEADPALLQPRVLPGEGAPTSAELNTALGRSEPTAAAPAPAPAAPVQVAAAQPINNGTTISDEQDFEAVSARETIESDAARIEAIRSQRVDVQPGALPERTDSGEPNLVAYALRTSNEPGQAVYSRALASERRAARACSKFTSPDRAQAWFLANGGPQRNPKGLDPDGDGFACGWDPRPFRTVRQAG